MLLVIGAKCFVYCTQKMKSKFCGKTYRLEKIEPFLRLLYYNKLNAKLDMNILQSR